MKLSGLVLSALWLLLWPCSLSGAETGTDIPVSLTILNELQSITERQEARLLRLKDLYQEQLQKATEQSRLLQEASGSIARSQEDLQTARRSLTNAYGIITEQRRSLESLSEELKRLKNSYRVKGVAGSVVIAAVSITIYEIFIR